MQHLLISCCCTGSTINNSFGYSASDALQLVQLACKTLQGTRQARGEHDELTHQVSSLRRALQRLQEQLATPDSLLNRAADDRRDDLNELGNRSEDILNAINLIITKYNSLPDTERHGEMKDLAKIRCKLSENTSAISTILNLCSLDSQGKVEAQLNNFGGKLEGIRGKVDWVTANITARSGEGSVWTSYTNDDRSFWRKLRRGLHKTGYNNSTLDKHKQLIRKYVQELGERGVFDQDEGLEQHSVELENVDLEMKDPVGMQSEEIELKDVRPGYSEREDSPPPPLHIANSLLQQDNPPKQSGSSSAPLAEIQEPGPDSVSSEPSETVTATRASEYRYVANPSVGMLVKIEDIQDENSEPGAHSNALSSSVFGLDERVRQVTKPTNSNTVQDAVQEAKNIESCKKEGSPICYETSEYVSMTTLSTNTETLKTVNKIKKGLLQEQATGPEPTNKGKAKMLEDNIPNFILLSKDKTNHTFKDALGRKFVFPYNEVKNWAVSNNFINLLYI